MNHAAVEDQLINALNAYPQFSDVALAAPFPEKEKDKILPANKALATVVFGGEKYDEIRSTGHISQPFTATYQVHIQSKFLRGEQGIYQLAEIVKAALLGLQVSDGEALTLQDHSFEALDTQYGIWEHVIGFATKSLRGQEYESYLPSDQIFEEETFIDKDNLKVQSNETIHV